MKLSLGFSPCPNDTFIFDAIVHHKIDLEGLEFEIVLGDVEELNQSAFRADLDITKLSYHAYAYLLDDYVLLHAGSALGRNCGPLLIARKALSKEEIERGPLAIPGKYTTANFLLDLAYPNAQNKQEVLFSEIEEQVVQKQSIAGLIIHENRFTYQDKGLVQLIDLGEYWEQETKMPIPLGGIVVKRNLPRDIQEKVNRVMARSVAFAQANPMESMPYVRQFAQAMQDEVMQSHIQLYVNKFTRDLGEEGKAAIQHLFDMARDRNLIPSSELALWL